LRVGHFRTPEKADIEIVSGILEVVGITAEEGHLLLGAKTNRTSS